MAAGRDEMRGVTGLLLVVNLVLYLIIIGLASWCLNQEIDPDPVFVFFNPNHRTHLGGNMATRFVLMYALLGGVIGASSVTAGFIHNRAWGRDSLGIATSTALISFAVTALAFGLVCKEIALGGYRGNILKALEIVVIVSTFFQMLYLLLLHAGVYNSRYGPAYS